MSGPHATSPAATSVTAGPGGTGTAGASGARTGAAQPASTSAANADTATTIRRGRVRSGAGAFSRPSSIVTAWGGLRDLHEELDVRARLAELVQQQVDGLLVVQRPQHPAELHHHRVLVRRHEQLLLTGARVADVDGREDPLVRDLAVQLELGVAGALKLLEDHGVHRGPGL